MVYETNLNENKFNQDLKSIYQLQRGDLVLYNLFAPREMLIIPRTDRLFRNIYRNFREEILLLRSKVRSILCLDFNAHWVMSNKPGR